MPDLEDLSLEQQLALRSAAANLRRSSTACSASRPSSSSSPPATTSSRPTPGSSTFLPLMAERFARQRLKALAKVEGKADDGTPDRAVPLRPQRRAVPDGARLVQPPRRRPGHRLVGRLRARQGGEPGRRRWPWPRWASTSRTEFPKPWTDEIVRAADVVITMGCGDACPLFPGKRYEDWELEDPAGKTSTPSAPSATTSRSASADSSNPSACPSTCDHGRARPRLVSLLGRGDQGWAEDVERVRDRSGVGVLIPETSA